MLATNGVVAAFVLALSMVFAMPAAAQSTASSGKNTVLAHATRHDRLLSVAFHDNFGIAVGEAGRVMVSKDGGKSWHKETPPSSLELMDVATDGKHTIIVSELGVILAGAENGPWHKVSSGTKQRLLTVSLNDKGVAYIVGAFGTLLKSTDHGKSWKSIAPDWKPLYNNTGSLKSIVPITQPTNYVVQAFNDGSVVIGGEYGEILRSVDQGKTWNLAYRFPKTGASQVPPTIFGLHISEDGTGYAVGQSGLILKTTDYGKSWVRINAPAADDHMLFAVDAYPDGRVGIVGMRLVLRSDDGGKTWTDIKGLDFGLSWYDDIGHPASASPGEFYAVGNHARIVRLMPGQ